MIDQLDPQFVAAYAEWLGVTDGEAYELLKAEPLVDITDEPEELTAATFVEADHPRHPEGTAEGGQFAPKTGAVSLSETEKEALRGYREGLRRASDMGFLDQTHLSGHFMNMLARGQYSDEEAAEYLYNHVWGYPMRPDAPIYKDNWPRAVENVKTARANMGTLDDLIADSILEEDFVVYRGVRHPADVFLSRQAARQNANPLARKAFKENPSSIVGREFTDKGFTATTYDEAVARSFGGAMYGKWVLRFTVPAGTPALIVKENGLKSGLPKHKSESELLLGRGHRFRVKAVDPETNTIDLELVK